MRWGNRRGETSSDQRDASKEVKMKTWITSEWKGQICIYFEKLPSQRKPRPCPPSSSMPWEMLQSFALPLQSSCWAQGIEVRVVQKCKGACPLMEKQFSFAPWLQRILRHSTFAISQAMWMAAFPLGRQLIVALWLRRTERLSRCPYMTARWSPVAQDIFNL